MCYLFSATVTVNTLVIKKVMLVKDWPTSRMLMYAIKMLIYTITFLIS